MSRVEDLARVLVPLFRQPTGISFDENKYAIVCDCMPQYAIVCNSVQARGPSYDKISMRESTQDPDHNVPRVIETSVRVCLEGI